MQKFKTLNDSHQLNIAEMSESESASSESTNDGENTWEVAEILAERQTFDGDTELLVVWKSCWAPVALVKDGPVLRKWKTVTKLCTPGNMTVKLPVIRGTQLYADYSKIISGRASERRQREELYRRDDTTHLPIGVAPRKQLDSVAKRR